MAVRFDWTCSRLGVRGIGGPVLGLLRCREAGELDGSRWPVAHRVEERLDIFVEVPIEVREAWVDHG
jgi:hypothetical protein